MVTGRQQIYRGRVVDLGLEAVRFPDGRSISLEVVRHPGGAAVVALDPVGCVCLVRQYRHAAGGWIWELPAGKLDPAEAPIETAARELEEEAGLRAADWTPLGLMLSTPGFCDEAIHLFRARALTQVPRRTEPHEFIEVHWVGLAEAWRWALQGTVSDAKTIVGLCRAQSLGELGRGHDEP